MTATAMDKSDREIVRLLRIDGRVSFVDLARSIGMSPDAVKARMARLADQGTMRVLGMIDPALLGYNVLATVTLDHRGVASDLLTALRKDDSVTYAATTLGEFNVICEVAAADDESLRARVEAITAGDAGIMRAEVLRNVEIYKWENSGSRPTHSRPAELTADDLDELDRTALRVLVDDPRISHRELAERIGYPYSLVRRRVLRLFDTGAIHASAVVEPAAEQLTVGLLFLEFDAVDADSALRAIARQPEVKILARTLGRFDATAEVAVHSPCDLARVGDRLRGECGVRRASVLLLTGRPILPAQWRIASVTDDPSHNTPVTRAE